MCDFRNIFKKGLNVHIRRKHGNIELIDGNMEEKDSNIVSFVIPHVHCPPLKLKNFDFFL